MAEEKTKIDDASRFGTEEPMPTIIKAVGVGGGGNNAVDHMYKEGIKHVSFVNINTDRQSINNCSVPNRIVIGPGEGAGNDPAVGRKLAEENIDKISSIFEDGTKMVFITAGMGGGTGTGAAPVVARMAKEHGMLTIGIVTIPFIFEGRTKILKALDGANEMAKYVDALLVINNERLIDIYPNLTFIDGFAKADDTLSTAARSIAELITSTGHINVDFNDVNTTLRNGGSAIISTGYGEGDHRVTKAIQNALNSPLLKHRNIMGSKRLLFNLYFSQTAENGFMMDEVNELTDFISGIADVDVIWGLAFDNELGDKVKITILAAGFEVSLEDEEETIGYHPPTGESKPRVPGTVLDSEYGKNILKDSSRFIILRPDQMDDDKVITILEEATAIRDKNVVKSIKSNLEHTSPTHDQDSHPTNTIDFA